MIRRIARFLVLPFALSFVVTLPLWYVTLNVLPSFFAR